MTTTPTIGTMTIAHLEELSLEELRDMAKTLDITGYSRLKKYDLVMRLLRANAEQQGFSFGGGILEVVADGIGFLRSDHLLPGTGRRLCESESDSPLWTAHG